MTATKTVARLLLDRPSTTQELTMLTNFDMRKTVEALRSLKEKKRVVGDGKRPASYSLTNAGLIFASKEPCRSPKAAKRHAEYQALRREREKERLEAARKIPRATGQRLIDRALVARPVLEAVWGGVYA